MRRLRFSIAHLLLVVLFCGASCAALKSASELWAGGLFTLTIGILLFALLGVIYRGGIKRAFWVGFAVVGWGYLLLTLLPESRTHLATTLLLDILYGRLFETHVFSPDGRLLPLADVSFVRLWESGPGNLNALSAPHPVAFQRIGHSLLTMLIAYLGSGVARFLCATQADRRGVAPEETWKREREPTPP